MVHADLQVGEFASFHAVLFLSEGLHTIYVYSLTGVS